MRNCKGKCRIFVKIFSMSKSASQPPKLHPRNLHHGRYDLALFTQLVPQLKEYMRENPNGEPTIDFSVPKAVALLNEALLRAYYGIRYWNIPATHLCPPVPGRADYLHYLADLLAEANNGEIPKGNAVRILDLGTGATAIYPVLGHALYDWQFVATDCEKSSLTVARNTVTQNPQLKGKIEFRFQSNKRQQLKGIIQPGEQFAASMCNPPFFGSREEALAQTAQKNRNLGIATSDKTSANFSGQNNELWCPGGELAFVTNYIYESRHYSKQVGWFSSLISRKEHLPTLERLLKKLNVKEVRVIPMAQGQKISRILAWKWELFHRK